MRAALKIFMWGLIRGHSLSDDFIKCRVETVGGFTPMSWDSASTHSSDLDDNARIVELGQVLGKKDAS